MNLPYLPRIWLFIVLASCVYASAQSEPSVKPAHGPVADLQTQTAFEHFYNMDWERATQEMEKVVDKHPNDASAVNHLLTAVLMHDLYDTGAMNTGDYANDSFIGHAARPTDAKTKERIKSLVHRALSIEDTALKANSSDVNAL